EGLPARSKIVVQGSKRQMVSCVPCCIVANWVACRRAPFHFGTRMLTNSTSGLPSGLRRPNPPLESGEGWAVAQLGGSAREPGSAQRYLESRTERGMKPWRLTD